MPVPIPKDEAAARRWIIARLQGVIAMLEDANTSELVGYAWIHSLSVSAEFDEFMRTYHYHKE